MDNGVYLKEVGNKIRACRLKKKMSLTTLSNVCKIDMSNIWYIEKGLRNPHILTLKSIADALGTDIKKFL